MSMYQADWFVDDEGQFDTEAPGMVADGEEEWEDDDGEYVVLSVSPLHFNHISQS